jgi:hypothetical protein
MARILTQQEMDDILRNNPPYRSLTGLNSPIFVRKLDVYSGHLMTEFRRIDTKYSSSSLVNRNKGKKGELVLCGIIDLTMWRFGFSLGHDYKVQYEYGRDPYSHEGGIDFRLQCKNWIFLCEAKNWFNTYTDQRTYEDKIQSRFRFTGINVLMIREDKVLPITSLSQQDPPLNKQPINFLKIHNSMADKVNIEEHINENLLWGVEQLTILISVVLGQTIQDREFFLNDCLQLHMPSWFIKDYINVSYKTINRASQRLRIRRNSKNFIKMTNYRHLRH